MAARVGMLSAILSANTTQFKKGMKDAQASAKTFANSIQAQNRKLKKFGKTMSKVGKDMSLKLSLPIIALGALATKTFASFEQEMAKVKAISGATAVQFKELSKLAEDLGASTRFTASEVATLELNYSKLGFVPEQIKKITASTLDLALATGEDLAESALVAGATLRGFGKQAEEMPKVIDVMALSFSKSALNLEKFKDVMKTVAPVAKAVNSTLETTVAIASTLVDAGLDASTAGTSLRNIFIELASKGITWNQAMNKIRNSTNKVKTATDLFGKRASTAALIIAENSDKIDDLTRSYEGAAGAAKKMADIMDATLEGAMLRVKSAVEAVGISFGRVLAPVLTEIAGGIAGVATWFKDLEDSTKKIILVIAGLAAAIGPLLVVMGFLVSTILPALLTGLAILGGPITLLVIGIAALTAGMVAYAMTAGEVTKELTLQEKITKRLAGAGDNLNRRLAQEKGHIEDVFKALKDENISRNFKKSLTEDLNREYGKYLPNLLSENSSLKDIKLAEEAINDVMRERLALMIGQEEVVAIVKQFREEEEKLVKILKVAGFTEAQLLTLKEASSTYTEIAEAVKKLGEENLRVATGADVDEGLEGLVKVLDLARNRFVAIDGEIISVSNTMDKLTGIGREQEKAVRDITSAYKNLITVTTGIEGISTALITTAISTEELKKRLKDLPTEMPLLKEIEKLPIAINNAALKIERIWGSLGQDMERIWRDIVNKIAEETRKIAEVVSSIWSGMSNIFAQSMRNQEIELENRYKKERELIERSLITNEQKNKAFLRLDERITNERKKLAREQAKTQKASALMGAIVNTALAVTSAITVQPIWLGIALAATVGAMGAAEISIINQEPLPALAKGGLAFSEMDVTVGEKSTRTNPEIITPLDKLKKFIQPAFNFKLSHVIRGDELILLLETTKENNSFVQ